MMVTWGKKLCMWCENEAITTIVHIPACRSHHNEYHQRRQSGEEWPTIHQDFWRRRWADEGAVRAAMAAWDARDDAHQP